MKYLNPRCLICSVCQFSAKRPATYVVLFLLLIAGHTFGIVPGFHRILILFNTPDPAKSILLSIGDITFFFLLLLAANALNNLFGRGVSFVNDLIKFICKEE